MPPMPEMELSKLWNAFNLIYILHACMVAHSHKTCTRVLWFISAFFKKGKKKNYEISAVWVIESIWKNNV